MLRAIELGQFALTSSVSELIPEFTGHGREKVQIWHLLSHQAGFPIIFEVKPEMYIDRFEEMIAAACLRVVGFGSGVDGDGTPAVVVGLSQIAISSGAAAGHTNE